MKHSLQLKLSQHLTLTPQLQQSIRLLQLSTLELNQEIERFLQDNPLLERDEGAEEEGNAAQAPAPAPVTTEPTTPTTTTTSTTSQEESEKSNAAEPEQDWIRDDSGGNYSGHDDGEDSDYPQLAADAQSLRDHLLWQVNLLKCSDRDKRIVAMLVDTLDDDGYLTQDLDELAAMLPAETGIDREDLQRYIRHVKGS